MKEVEVWLARDSNGQLYLYLEKPFKSQDCWIAKGRLFCGINNFSSVKWEDEEPVKAKIILNE